MKKTTPLFLLTVLFCSTHSYLLAQTTPHFKTQAIDQNKNQIVSNFILPTTDTAAEANSITVGEYVTFLNAVAFNEDVHELYYDAMGSQIVWASEEDGYVIAAGVGSDDLMLNLTSFDVNDYFNWVANSSPHKSDSYSPLMMFGEDEKMPGAGKSDPRATDRDRDRTGSASGAASSQAARGDANNFSLTEAATQTANQARENLTVEAMPGGDASSRDSRIHIATETSAIANMLVSYVSDTRRLFSSHHPESAQKAAAWEATVNESLHIAKTALVAATDNHHAIEKVLEPYKKELADSTTANQEAEADKISAMSNLKAAAVNAAGAVPAAALGHLGPLLTEGGNLTLVGVKTLCARWNAEKRADQVTTATDNLKYAVAKKAVLESIKNSAANLHDKLVPIQKEAERSLFAAMGNKTESEIESIRQAAQASTQSLMIAHAEDLIAWANDQAEQTPATSQVAVLTAQSNQAHAQNILDAIRFRPDVLAKKETADKQLSLAKTQKTAIESLLHTTQTALDNAQKALDAKYPKSSITGTRSLNYKASEEYIQKHATKIKVEELEAAVKQAALALVQAENIAQAATQDMAKVDARLNIWNNLKALHTVAIVDQLKDPQDANEHIFSQLAVTAKTAQPTSPVISNASERDELSDQKLPQQPASATEAASEDVPDNFMIADMSDEMRDQLKTAQLGHLASDLSEENKERERILRLKKAGKPIEPAAVKKSSSSADASSLDTELDNMARNRLMLEHTAYAADQTGAVADVAINRFIAVSNGETEDPSSTELPPPVDNPMGAAVTAALITRERFNVVDETSKKAQDAVAAYKKAAEERKKNQAAKLALLKK